MFPMQPCFDCQAIVDGLRDELKSSKKRNKILAEQLKSITEETKRLLEEKYNAGEAL